MLQDLKRRLVSEEQGLLRGDSIYDLLPNLIRGIRLRLIVELAERCTS